jgi:protein MpaA
MRRHRRLSCLLATAAVLVVAGAAPASSARGPQRMRLLGRSVEGRRITAFRKGRDAAARPVMVIGSIHGNETAGIAIARDLAIDAPAPGTAIWVVLSLNPDGVHAGTRANAHGVDLNRNWPFRWRRLGPPGSTEYAGRRALSEPESRFATKLIKTIRPAVTIWFHQALGVVDASGGTLSIERGYSRRVGLPLVRLPRYPGSAATWQNHVFPGTTSFVVELPPGPLDRRGVERFSDAIVAIAQSLAPAGS